MMRDVVMHVRLNHLDIHCQTSTVDCPEKTLTVFSAFRYYNAHNLRTALFTLFKFQWTAFFVGSSVPQLS